MYATVQDCIDRLGEKAVRLLGDVKGGDPPAYGLLEKALADASAEIDAYVGTRHRLPLDPVPETLERLCVEIAVYRRSGDAALVTRERRDRYDAAIRFLRDVGAGRASLGVTDPDPPAASASPAVEVSAPRRVMGRDSLRRVL